MIGKNRVLGSGNSKSSRVIFAASTSIDRYGFQFSVLFPGIGHRVLIKDGIEPHGGLEEWHVAKHSRKCIDARLPLGKVAWITPGRSEKAIQSCLEAAWMLD